MSYKTESLDDLGAKAGMLRIAGERIKTPVRVLTSNENEQGERLELKHLVSNRINYNTPIIQFTKNLNAEYLESFATQTEVSFSLEQELKDFANKHENAFPIFNPIIPSYASKKPVILGILTNRKLMQAQINANYEIVTVQDKHALASAEELDNRIINSEKFLNESGWEAGQIIVNIKTATDDQIFKDKLKVCEDRGVKMLILEASSTGSYLPNLKYIPKFARKNDDVFIHGSQIDRMWRGNRATSMMHFSQTFAYDSFAVKLMPPIPFNTPVKLVRKNSKIFDAKPLGFLKSAEYERLNGNNLGYDCPVTERRNLDDLFNTFSGTRQLRSALNIREFFNSAIEFENSRIHIKEQDYRSYAKTKKFLLEAWNKLLGIDLRNSSLKFFRK